MKPSLLVSLIIVNFNGFEITKNCLESIYSSKETSNPKPQALNISFEITVVDNASTDGSVARLKKAFLRKMNFQVIARKNNDFLAAAYNEGFNYSRGNIIICLTTIRC